MKMKTSVYKKLYALFISTALFITTTYAKIAYIDVKPGSGLNSPHNLNLNNDLTLNYATQSGPLYPRECNHDPPVFH